MSSPWGVVRGNSNFQAVAAGLKALGDDKSTANFIKTDVKAVQKECWEIVRQAAIALAPEDTGRLKEMIMLKVGYNPKTRHVYAIVGLRRIGRKERSLIQHTKKFGREVTRTEKNESGEVIRREKVLRGPTRKELDALEFDAYYGVFVEFGTEHQQAQPFMRPAFDQKFQAVFRLYGWKLKERLQRRLESIKSGSPMRKL